jgi:hypothetical protein
VSSVAIFSLSLSNVSRSTGGNSCATLAYISGKEIECDRTKQTFKYGHQDRVVAVNTYLPDGADEKYYIPSNLINGIENVEKNKNAITARKIIVALPRELDRVEREMVLGDFVENEITNRNFACVVAIHDDLEDKNPHAHILIPNRPFEDGDFAKQKRKSEYALDEKGNKIPILDEHGNQKIGERGRKMWLRVYSSGRNALDQKDTLQSMREGWEKACNKFLNDENKIDHRSYKERGIEQLPTIHEGYIARKKEKIGDGFIDEKCEYNRSLELVREFNREFNDEYDKRQLQQEEIEEKLQEEIQKIGQEMLLAEQELIARQAAAMAVAKKQEEERRERERREEEQRERDRIRQEEEKRRSEEKKNIELESKVKDPFADKPDIVFEVEPEQTQEQQNERKDPFANKPDIVFEVEPVREQEQKPKQQMQKKGVSRERKRDDWSR